MVNPALLKPQEILSDIKFTLQSPSELAYGTRGTSVTALTAEFFAPHDIIAVSSSL